MADQETSYSVGTRAYRADKTSDNVLNAVVRERPASADSGLVRVRQTNVALTPISCGTGPGNLHGCTVHNAHASAKRTIKFYDKATSPTVGTDTPIFSYECPIGENTLKDKLPMGGLHFTTILWMASTVNYVDSDTTAPTANDVAVHAWVALNG